LSISNITQILYRNVDSRPSILDVLSSPMFTKSTKALDYYILASTFKGALQNTVQEEKDTILPYNKILRSLCLL
jgi:hypothetical protein